MIQNVQDGTDSRESLAYVRGKLRPGRQIPPIPPTDESVGILVRKYYESIQFQRKFATNGSGNP